MRKLTVLNEEAILQMAKHYELLKRNNPSLRLISKGTVERAFSVHYIDSLMITKFLTENVNEKKIYDFGSGAGFPGLIFAIANKNHNVFLFEKDKQKNQFLTTSARELGLTNVTICGVIPDKLSKGAVFSRAFMPREKLFHFIKQRLETQSFVLMTSGGQSNESESPRGFEKFFESSYLLPNDEGNRRVEIFKFVSRGTKNTLFH